VQLLGCLKRVEKGGGGEGGEGGGVGAGEAKMISSKGFDRSTTMP